MKYRNSEILGSCSAESVSLTSWEEEASLALVCHLLQQMSSFDRSLITHSLPFCWKPLIFTSLNGYIIKST